MKAAQLIAPKEFALTDIPEPARGPGEILIRVNRAGVCGSDLHFYHLGRIGGAELTGPFVMGHEFGGVVVDNGGLPGAPANGARVAADPAVSCGECPWCRAGRPNICPNVKFTGFPPYRGAYAELISIPRENVFPVPDRIPDEAVPVIETLAVALHGLELVPDVKGKTCAVLGAGTVGLLTMMLLLQRGANVALVTEPVPLRREAARAIGCEWTFDPAGGEGIRRRMDETCPHGFELIFEAAGEPESFQNAFDWLGPGGRAAIFGIHAEGACAMDFNTARRNEAEAVFVRRSLPRNYPEAIRLLDQGVIDISPVITHRFPLDEIGKAFELASDRRDGVVKAILTI